MLLNTKMGCRDVAALYICIPTQEQTIYSIVTSVSMVEEAAWSCLQAWVTTVTSEHVSSLFAHTALSC